TNGECRRTSSPYSRRPPAADKAASSTSCMAERGCVRIIVRAISIRNLVKERQYQICDAKYERDAGYAHRARAGPAYIGKTKIGKDAQQGDTDTRCDPQNATTNIT